MMTTKRSICHIKGSIFNNIFCNSSLDTFSKYTALFWLKKTFS